MYRLLLGDPRDEIDRAARREVLPHVHPPVVTRRSKNQGDRAVEKHLVSSGDFIPRTEILKGLDW